ncbi:MAG: hypothetical protein JWM86_700 [Thermoleophilia bacterium]|nr:hypothetical protein [Thermoleophilia bacterium]
MSTFSVGGLSSGLDTKSIISQLMDIEARPRVRKEWSSQLWKARQTVWSDLNTKLSTLQAKATSLNNPATWSSSGVTSSDATRLTGALSGPNPAVGTYALNVSQLATTEVWNAANATPPSVGGARQSGSWYQGAFTEATGSVLLTNLTDVDGSSLGLDAGSTISMSATKNGSPVTGSFNVTAGSTLDDLAQWAESNFPGASFTVNGDGTVSFQSAPGAANEITSMSFTATDSSAASLGVFNGTAGASSSFSAPPSGGGGADTLTITQGASVWNVAIGAGADDTAIAAAINGTAGIGVTASVVAGKLRIASTASGAAGDFTVTSSGGMVAALGLAQGVNGQDAMFDVNGTSYSRSKNTGIGDVLADVSLDLLATTTSAVTLTVKNGSASAADMKKKLLEFVDQYNAVVDMVNAKTSEKKVVNPKTLNDFVAAPLSRDFQLSNIGYELRRWATDTVSGLAGTDSLDDIGITTGEVTAGYSAANASGRLVVDEAKLDAALAANPDKVKDLFTKVGGGAGMADDGISRRISTLVSGWRTGGAVDSAMRGASRQISDIQSTIDRMNERLDRKRSYYERMFSGLETSLGRIQSQNSWLSGQFTALSS